MSNPEDDEFDVLQLMSVHARYVPPAEPSRRPRVLISGAGIGGLTLAILLHKADIPFDIFDRSEDLHQDGNPRSNSPYTALFRQLGIYEEFLKLGIPTDTIHVYKENLNHSFSLDFTERSKVGSGREYVIRREDLHDLLLRQIPREKLHLGNSVFCVETTDSGVLIHSTGGKRVRGDIIVGADGAFSVVRDDVLKTIACKKKITFKALNPKLAPYSSFCMVGETSVLDSSEFPEVDAETCQTHAVLGSDKNMCTWRTYTTKQKTVCWMVVKFLDKELPSEEEQRTIYQWSLEEVRDFKVPGGKGDRVLTIGDYIDRTPMIYRRKLFEEVLDHWFCGRAVLLGDACHPMHPLGMMGAINAIHDAVALANWINTLRSPSMIELKEIFDQYQAERLPIVKEAFALSQMFKQTFGKSIGAYMVRKSVKHMPKHVWNRKVTKISAYRPQVSFLPQVKDNGLDKPHYQRSLHMSLKVLEQHALEDEFEDEITAVATV
ncbi:hypothetical protein BGZ94_001092 [Podila epigama]|nr:hypothetical protein BGZ94_001092 [Podila epigama]